MAKAVAAATNSEDSNSGLQKITGGPERLLSFLKDVRQEMRKVVTPSRVEVQNTTIVVLVTVFLFVAYFALVDWILGGIIDRVLAHLVKR